MEDKPIRFSLRALLVVFTLCAVFFALARVAPLLLMALSAVAVLGAMHTAPKPDRRLAIVVVVGLLVSGALLWLLMR